jgi:chromosome segregation ATPase
MTTMSEQFESFRRRIEQRLTELESGATTKRSRTGQAAAANELRDLLRREHGEQQQHLRARMEVQKEEIATLRCRFEETAAALVKREQQFRQQQANIQMLLSEWEKKVSEAYREREQALARAQEETRSRETLQGERRTLEAELAAHTARSAEFSHWRSQFEAQLTARDAEIARLSSLLENAQDERLHLAREVQMLRLRDEAPVPAGNGRPAARHSLVKGFLDWLAIPLVDVQSKNTEE